MSTKTKGDILAERQDVGTLPKGGQMKKLEEYSTPVSNEASYARLTNHAGIKCKTETDSVSILVSRDLERKLAMCRDALREIAKYGKEHDGCCPYGCDTPYIATEAIKATEPK